ncbi:MAG: sigma-70 family RNA polymerase sigma factor [Deltaproteobacteria bacterium]|nr:MAG: sigma-70 family RNA polymerase sigma factor [Deltaproteobacteria bacterium]
MSDFEKNIVERLKAKDPSAFEEVMAAYEGKVYRLAFKICNDAAEVEEILQEVFLAVFTKIDGFQENASLSTWIYRITVNTALMKIRSRQKDRDTVSLESYFPRLQEETSHPFPISDWSERPDEKFFNKELIEKIEEAVQKLPEGYRLAFLMKDLEGLSLGEISEILEISIPAVKSRIHRSRLFIRDELARYL